MPDLLVGHSSGIGYPNSCFIPDETDRAPSPSTDQLEEEIEEEHDDPSNKPNSDSDSEESMRVSWGYHPHSLLLGFCLLVLTWFPSPHPISLCLLFLSFFNFFFFFFFFSKSRCRPGLILGLSFSCLFPENVFNLLVTSVFSLSFIDKGQYLIVLEEFHYCTLFRQDMIFVKSLLN